MSLNQDETLPKTTNCISFEANFVIPIGNPGDGTGYGDATSSLAGSVTRLFGLVVVLFGFFALFKLYTDLGVLADRYIQSLGMVSFTFSEQTVGGTEIGVAMQLTAFALACFFVGGMTLVESTRAKPSI